MTASAWNWVLAIVGTVASIAGVVFSWMAWVQAKHAKQAAEEARDAVRARDTAHELGELARDAKDLLTAVRAVEGQWAVKAATDLVHKLSILKGRRSGSLPKRTIPKIGGIVDALNLVCDALGEIGLPEDRRIITVQQCRQIHQRVCEIAGDIERKAEEP